MTRAAVTCSLSGLLLCVAAATVLAPAGGQPVPQQVTTDTPAYCLVLLDRVAELVRLSISPPAEVTRLSTEGRRMCDEGQTRGGILRLRRAIVLLEQPGNTQ